MSVLFKDGKMLRLIHNSVKNAIPVITLMALWELLTYLTVLSWNKFQVIVDSTLLIYG